MKNKKNTKTHNKLRERIKELNCLYGLSKLVERSSISLEEIFQGMVSLIPPAWQYSDVTCARIIFENKEFKTRNFKVSKWRQSSDIAVKGKTFGVLEVCYLKKFPESDEGPFMKEERALLEALSGRLGRIAAQMQAEDEVKYLAKFPAENPNPTIRISKDGVLLYANKASQPFFKEYGFKIGKRVSKEWFKIVSVILSSAENNEVEMICCNRTFLWFGALIADADYINFYGIDITNRKEAEEKIFRHEESLEQKNIVLKELLEQIELEKQKIKDDVAATVEELLLPALNKLRMKGASKKHVQVIKKNLKEMTSSFGRKISEKKLKLTPREIEICNMIKEGLSTKDIAGMQNISIKTIEKHRVHIRSKLGLANKKYNLTTYLQNI